MAEPSGTQDWPDGRRGRLIHRLSLATLIVVLLTLTVALAVTVAQGIVVAAETGAAILASRYLLAALAEASGALLVLLGYTLLRSRLESDLLLRTQSEKLSRIESLLEASQGKLQRLAELAPLSDQAKAMIFREREIDAVRETIHECLARQDYRQAEQLIERMDKQFGYHDEAERFRADVAASRQATIEEQVSAAIERVNQIVEQRNWARAMRESERLLQVFPENAKVQALSRQITEARSRHKRDLLSEYGEAVKRNDVDRSIALLKQLDAYLTPQEAAALQESARGVFRAKLHNLGIQFAIAVTDEHWQAALNTGEEIVNEFPNTQMAAEVRGKLDTLRQRAAAAAAETK